jgi:NAD(P)H dehydrogenase (quinone)
MHAKAKVMVMYYGADDLEGCRLALATAGGAWDAGAEVRVRRVNRAARSADGPGAHAGAEPGRAELLREAEDAPEASAEDLRWADAVLFETSRPVHPGSAQLRGLLDALRELPGGRVVPIGEGTRFVSRLADRGGRETRPGSPTDAELEAARDRGRRVMETVVALKAGGARLADTG